MKDIRSYLEKYTEATTDFPFGRLKPNSSNKNGSSITVRTFNDILYGFFSTIKKYRTGGLSGYDESEAHPDHLDALEEMTGLKIDGVAEWTAGETCSAGAQRMYCGVQFVSLIDSNTGYDPFENPDKWIMCPDFKSVFALFQDGRVNRGGLHDMHDPRSANYKQIFKCGRYKVGGEGGKVFQFYGVHIDGSTVSGELETILDPGGAEEYFRLDKIATENMGSYTLRNYKGCAGRAMDGDGGDTEAMGVRQEDAMERMTGLAFGTTEGASQTPLGYEGITVSGVLKKSTTLSGKKFAAGENGSVCSIEFDNQGVVRTDSETRMKNYSEGVPYVLVMKTVS